MYSLSHITDNSISPDKSYLFNVTMLYMCLLMYLEPALRIYFASDACLNIWSSMQRILKVIWTSLLVTFNLCGT